MKEDRRLAALNELLKHSGLDRGDMEAALRGTVGDSRLWRCAQAIADALRK